MKTPKSILLEHNCYIDPINNGFYYVLFEMTFLDQFVSYEINPSYGTLIDQETRIILYRIWTRFNFLFSLISKLPQKNSILLPRTSLIDAWLEVIFLRQFLWPGIEKLRMNKKVQVKGIHSTIAHLEYVQNNVPVMLVDKTLNIPLVFKYNSRYGILLAMIFLNNLRGSPTYRHHILNY